VAEVVDGGGGWPLTVGLPKLDMLNADVWLVNVADSLV
jgi:hypothetical protein